MPHQHIGMRYQKIRQGKYKMSKELKIHNILQNTPEWLQLRSGIPTASAFDKIISPTGKKSTQADGYANQLLAEIITGNPISTFKGSFHTERGKELEPDAVACYEMVTGNKTAAGGFITNKGAGCSADRLVGDLGLLEIKCPAAHTHIEYMLNDKMEPEYIPQVQAQLYISGRAWCDWMSYHPDLELVIIRVKRDEKYLLDMSEYLDAFFALLEQKRTRLLELGYTI